MTPTCKHGAPHDTPELYLRHLNGNWRQQNRSRVHLIDGGAKMSLSGANVEKIYYEQTNKWHDQNTTQTQPLHQLLSLIRVSGSRCLTDLTYTKLGSSHDCANLHTAADPSTHRAGSIMHRRAGSPALQRKMNEMLLTRHPSRVLVCMHHKVPPPPLWR